MIYAEKGRHETTHVLFPISFESTCGANEMTYSISHMDKPWVDFSRNDLTSCGTICRDQHTAPMVANAFSAA